MASGQLVCDELSRQLDEVYLQSGALSQLEAVDVALRAAGADKGLGLQSLSFRGFPIDVPLEEGTPSFGYLEPAEVAGGLRAYNDLSLFQVAPQARALAERFGAWLKSAEDRKAGLSGVLS